MAEKMVTKRSLIKKYFSDETYIDIIKIMKHAKIDNNKKGVVLKELLTKRGIPYISLGSGTNRFGILIDGYAVKIALDDAGRIDNLKEFLYTKELQPYVIKVYECDPGGLIAVSEYVTYFSLDDYHKYRSDMANILEDISNRFLIGDCGITSKNYINWGVRDDGSICILDFAYVYDTQFDVFMCKCNDETYLQYDENYVDLICPVCGRKYTFGEIRRRITRAQHDAEIGDIRRLSYNIKSAEEEVVAVEAFEPPKPSKKKDKKLSEEELLIKELEEKEKRHRSLDYIDDYWDNNEEEDDG